MREYSCTWLHHIQRYKHFKLNICLLFIASVRCLRQCAMQRVERRFSFFASRTIASGPRAQRRLANPA